MSWAEVKKINSNLSKPLDEILNDPTSGLVAIKNLATDIKDNTHFCENVIEPVAELR